MVHDEANQLIVQARAAGVELWIEGSRLRFKAPPGALSDELRDALRQKKGPVTAALRAQASARNELGPLAANQHGLWFLHQLVPSSFAYNLSFILRIRGQTNVEALRETLQVLADRNECLRTNYPLLEGTPKRQVAGYLAVELPVVDARAWDEQELRRQVQADHARPFDLHQGPVFRAKLFQESSGDSLFLISAHHIAVDATALFVLLEEFFSIYEAMLKGEAMPPVPAGATFAEFVAWQEKMLNGSTDGFAYWAKALTPPSPPLDLPTDRPRTRDVAMRGGTVHHVLTSSVSQAVQALAKSESTTDFVVLLSAWFVLLHRLSGSDDIVVGTPVLGRPSARFARTVGDLVNMLPLRVRSISELTFSELVQEVRRAVLDGVAHQDIPLPLMLERLAQQQGGGRPPFQTLFILQHFSHFQKYESFMLGSEKDRFEFGSQTVSPYRIDQQEGQFELAVDIWQMAGELHCSCRYDSDLYDRVTANRLIRQYEALLSAAAHDPQARVAQLPLLDPVARRALLEGFNATDVVFPPEQTAVALFAAQVVRRPGAIAVSHAGQVLNYGQLAAQSRQLARHLQTLGVGPETLVGVCVERSCNLLVAVLGILQAGGAYVPLDPGFPAERLDYMLRDSKAPVLITQSQLRQRLFPITSVTCVCLDLEGATISRYSPAELPAVNRPENRAYVLYTSGSTGRPKGVEIEHRALANFLNSMTREPGMGENDVLLAVTTLSFDIATLELLLPLATGGRIELADRDTALDGIALGRLMVTSNATIMQATPATWRLLLESGWTGRPQLKILCGGEAMGRDLATRLVPACRELWNMYGPTETTIWSSVARIHSPAEISIGHPIANTRMYVLDEHRAPVPPGVVGELWIGGDGLARGYLHQPELTAQRFVPNPFHAGRMYRTGDQARYRSDGNIDCLGRIDAQVKVRGYRIELGEIESVLSEIPDVAECAVVAQPNGGENQLVAYVVGRASTDACIQHLRIRLPEYMVPAIYVTLPVLPKTPNNKIDRKALPAPDRADPHATLEYVAPGTATEKVVAQILAEVLNRPAVGVNHNFFELGGHSLLATRAVVRLREHFKMEIPVKIFFQAPTAQGLSQWLDAAQEKVSSSPNPDLILLEPPSPWKCLVAAQPKGSRPPLFLITGYMDADDTLRILSNLIPHLGPDQPLCGLRPRWLDGHSPIYRSVEELTDEYLADLRSFQPEGPYYLLGDCVGGVVAVEMAQKLIAQGDEVALLVLLDTERPRIHSFLLTEVGRLWRRAKHVIEVLHQFWRPANGTRRQVIAEVFQRKLRRARLTDQPITATDHIYEQRMAYQRLLKRHRLKRYPGPIVLILTEDVFPFLWLLGWKGFARGGLEIRRTPGDHETFRAQFSRELCQCLRQCIDQARSRIARGKITGGANGPARVLQNIGP